MKKHKLIQPCSVDLRCDSHFWEYRRLHRFFPFRIDIRKGNYFKAIDPIFYDSKVLNDGEAMILKPGQLIFTRVAQKIKMPKDCAGKIIVRSGYSRLGLGIHCGAEFINPNWEGHFPLQIFNYGKYPIKLYPRTSFAQLILIPLSEIPLRTYGEGDLKSNYQDDTGGPSKFWNDYLLTEIKQSGHRQSIDTTALDEAIDLLAVKTDNQYIIIRFANFIENLKVKNINNSQDILESFWKKEKRRWIFSKILNKYFFNGLTGFGCLSLFLNLLYKNDLVSKILFIISLLLFCVSIVRTIILLRHPEQFWIARDEVVYNDK